MIRCQNVKDSILKYYVNWKFHLVERDIYNSINLYSEPEQNKVKKVYDSTLTKFGNTLFKKSFIEINGM